MASSSSSFSSPSWLDLNQESPHLSNIALNRITGLGVLNHQEKCRCLCLSFSECVRLTPLQRATSKANGRGLFHIAISAISIFLSILFLSLMEAQSFLCVHQRNFLLPPKFETAA